MNEPFVIVGSKSAVGRIALVGVILAVLVFAWFGVRWQLGSMLAELTHPSEPNAEKIAQLSRTLAPRDPATMYLTASKEKENFSPESFERAVQLFERLVRLSPYDFRWWIELGRAYEQAERTEDAEAAFARAVELAPTYTFPHWQFGNFYAARGSAENALRVWNTLTDEQKSQYQDTAKRIARGLFEKQRYREAIAFSIQTGIDPDAQPDSITNGGFEKFVGAPDDNLFGWRVYRGEGRVDILPDSNVKFEGTRSLRISFKGYSKPELHNVVQFIAVQPGARYRLSFMVRTDNLRSGGPPMVQVISTKQNVGIASTEPFSAGSEDWKPVMLEFVAPEDFDGVHVRMGRVSCGEDCPITGTIWFDDFRLIKL